jgi:hypothetical protein
MVSNYTQYHSKTTDFRISPSVKSKDETDFAMLFTLKTTRKAGGFGVRRSEVQDSEIQKKAIILQP